MKLPPTLSTASLARNPPPRSLGISTSADSAHIDLKKPELQAFSPTKGGWHQPGKSGSDRGNKRKGVPSFQRFNHESFFRPFLSPSCSRQTFKLRNTLSLDGH